MDAASIGPHQDAPREAPCPGHQATLSENQHLIGRYSPLGEQIHVASFDAFDQPLLPDPAGIKTGPSSRHVAMAGNGL